MNENDDSQETAKLEGLPIEYQLGDRVYKTDIYIENYIVKIEIYKPKDKLRKPTLKTVNRIFRRLGDVRILPKSEEQEEE
jgi:hypothetical protein